MGDVFEVNRKRNGITLPSEYTASTQAAAVKYANGCSLVPGEKVLVYRVSRDCVYFRNADEMPQS